MDPFFAIFFVCHSGTSLRNILKTSFLLNLLIAIIKSFKSGSSKFNEINFSLARYINGCSVGLESASIRSSSPSFPQALARHILFQYFLSDYFSLLKLNHLIESFL